MISRTEAQLRAPRRRGIRAKASPRHVARRIFEVDAAPSTLDGKRVERSAKASANAQPVKNKRAMTNPEVLAQYAELTERDSA